MSDEVDLDQIEEDDEEGQLKTGNRSAFMAGLFRSQGDGFTGSFRGVPAPKRGGSAYVRPEDTLGDQEHCWCGLPAGHDWQGKAGGAPHPRTEKGIEMTAAARNLVSERLDKRQLRKFDDRVARMVMSLVNEHGVPYRMQKDGVHVLLYPLNNAHGGRPYKVGEARGAEQTMAYLETWVTEAVTPALVASQAELLAAKFNDPTKVRRIRKDQSQETQATQEPQETTPSQEATESPESDATPRVAVEDRKHPFQPDPVDPVAYAALPEGASPQPEGYIRATARGERNSNRGEPLNWWVKEDGSHYKCMFCDYEAETLYGKAAHMRMHTMSAEQRSELSGRAGAAKNERKKIEAARMSLLMLAEITGVSLTDDEKYAVQADKLKVQADKLKREIENLAEQLTKVTAKLEKVTTERDDLKARYELIREAMRA
jgi:hypothetical protein